MTKVFIALALFLALGIATAVFLWLWVGLAIVAGTLLAAGYVLGDDLVALIPRRK